MVHVEAKEIVKRIIKNDKALVCEYAYKGIEGLRIALEERIKELKSKNLNYDNEKLLHEFILNNYIILSIEIKEERLTL